MGICDSINDKTRINEVEISNSPLNKVDRWISYISPSICKIKCLNKKGTGCLIKLKKTNEEDLYFLMTNEHVIARNIVEAKEKINISYDFGEKEKEIDLNKDKRFIKDYMDINIDIIIIQILEEDNIDKKYFLLPYMGEISNLKGKRICIAQIPKGKELFFSEGDITKIQNYELAYDATTDKGSSGSPIFLKNTTEVIGIHKQGNTSKPENYGNFLFPIIQSIKLNNENEYNKKEDYNTNKRKFIYENGDYYIGEWLNGLRHGKGKLYYENGNIKYEGNFIKDKFEGKGQYNFENGEYYIGEWLNDQRHGRGKLYYKNCNIKYDGDFIKDKFEGEGQYIWENGEYYIGNWLNNLKHGKGILYYKNGNIKYDGDFIKDKAEGKGKYIKENGEYYIGEWENGLMHGKGTLFYKDDNIKYEGDFVEDKFEGNGKYIFQNGNYYVGQWLNGLRNGEGTYYYKDGSIKYQGNFINDKYCK